MEKKPINTYQMISKSALKNLNKNFEAPIIKDENRIDEIMSEFMTGELNTIYSKLNSNEILNFKDQTNQTLIHAILRNESPNITEENKLEIIQKLVGEKNVSLHTMTNYNQNGLHIACQKGYVLIIDYMIKNNCDQTLIDNYGNTSLHYLIDKFIIECGDNDFYSQTNQNIKQVNSDELEKINKILNNESILILYELLDIKKDEMTEYYCMEVGEDGYKIINALKKIIKNKIQSSLTNIYELIEKKTNEINKIFYQHGESNEYKFEKAKKIIYSINNDIFQIYGLNFDFKNVVWNNFLSNQNLQIKNKKNELKKNIIKSIENLKTIQSDMIERMRIEFINNIYKVLSKFANGLTLLFYFLLEFMYNDKTRFFTNDEVGKIFELEQPNKDTLNIDGKNELNVLINNIAKIITKLYKINFYVFLCGSNNINNLDTIDTFNCNFIDNHAEFAYIFYYNKEQRFYDNYIQYVHTYDKSGNLILYIPNYSNLNDIIPEMIKKFKNITKDLNENISTNLLKAKFELDLNFIYSPIRIIITYINLIFESIMKDKLSNLFGDDTMQQFCLFDIKYLSEFIFKIINNLVILEKYFNDININELNDISNSIKQYFDSLFESKNLNKEFINFFQKFKCILEQILIPENFIEHFKLKKYAEVFNYLYDNCTNILDKFTDIVKNINEYNSLIQLEKYNEFLSEIISSEKIEHKELTNTFFNNYSFNLKYVPKYSEYKNIFFKIKDDINLYEYGIINNGVMPSFNDLIINLNYKKDFVEKIWYYTNTNDFNIFYLNTQYDAFTTKYLYEIKYSYLDINITDDLCFFNIKTDNYNLKNYLFDITPKFKFSRGYDVIKYNINNEINNMENILGKNEKKTLVNIEFIEKYSDYDEKSKSIEENKSKIVSWMFEDKLVINNIDDIDTYIITNNLNELINMLVYMIYEKITNVQDVFFTKMDLNYINKNDSTDNKIEKIGIDLDYIELNDTTKINIKNTLDFIKKNSIQKQKYLYDNIKLFVKILLYEEINREIFKIMEEIKITDLSDTLDTSTFKLTKKQINSKFKQITKNYKTDFLTTKLSEFIRELTTSTLNFQEMINFQEILNSSKLDNENLNKKIINSKCLNKNKTDELMELNMNYKVLDMNGNTIIIRLIDQYNIYGLNKLIEKNKKVLFTYKNNNMETPLDYLTNLMKNIQTDYNDDAFKQRIERYNDSLENIIKTNDQFDNIELTNSSNLIKTIILNSIYLFNSYLWIKNYSYPSGWTVSDKNNLKNILNFNEEKLLMNSIKPDDLSKKYIVNIKNITKSKMSSYIDFLQKEIIELENKSKELGIETNNDFIKSQTNYNITTNISDINNKIYEKKQLVEQYKNIENEISNNSYSEQIDEINKLLINYENNLLDMNYLTIDWHEYTKLLNELDNKYLELINIQNEECEKTPSINNHLIKIFCQNIVFNQNFDLIKKYFKLIFVKMFDDYWDLDRYDDSDYNITNKSIIQILKINVVGIIKNELLNTLSNYIIQLNKISLNDISVKIKSNDELKKSIKTYLYDCLVKKLNIFNPLKSNLLINIDEHKIIIINILEKILNNKFDETEQIEIKKIIEFNRFICENIGLNCYDEIVKMLYDGKKMALYYEMYDLIQNNT